MTLLKENLEYAENKVITFLICYHIHNLMKINRGFQESTYWYALKER